MENLDRKKFEALFEKPDKDERSVIIRGVDIHKVYKMGKQETHALRGATLDVYRGEYLSIMGPSGSGKSTLFNAIGALQKPTSGRVYIDQVDIAQLDTEELAWLRCRKIGYVFQSYNLIQVMTCLENVTLPMSFAGLSAEEAREKGIKILKMVGLGHRILHKPAELSGGQQQRVAIARALANNPSILLCDEPTGNLDLKSGKDIHHLLHDLNKNAGVTVICATHDPNMLAVSDRMVWITDGRIARIDESKDVEIAQNSLGDGQEED